MLNNKATNVKLESANYLAIQTKQCDKQGYTNQISHAKGILLATQARRYLASYTSTARYKSNNTNKVYMKVNISLCCMKVNHREE
jgi:ribosomal protein L44E